MMMMVVVVVAMMMVTRFGHDIPRQWFCAASVFSFSRRRRR